jgi:hypothetical protein
LEKQIAENGDEMKIAYIFLIAAFSLPTFAADQKPAPTLKSILLEQLRSTHNKAEWFVPANTAVDGLTAEQASWTDGKGNHSVGQLANHLIFWNRQELAKFKGEPPRNSAATTMKPSTASIRRSGMRRSSNSMKF